MVVTAGIRKALLTPPIWTTPLASRGKPRTSVPTSVVVPPTSTTTAASVAVRKAAPRSEFVVPEEKLKTGKRSAAAARAMVPSFWVM